MSNANNIINLTNDNAEVITATIKAMGRAARDNKLVAKNWRELSLSDLATVVAAHLNRPSIDTAEVKRIRANLANHAKVLAETGGIEDGKSLTVIKESGAYRMAYKAAPGSNNNNTSAFERAIKLLGKAGEEGDEKAIALARLINDHGAEYGIKLG